MNTQNTTHGDLTVQRHDRNLLTFRRALIAGMATGLLFASPATAAGSKRCPTDRDGIVKAGSVRAAEKCLTKDIRDGKPIAHAFFDVKKNIAPSTSATNEYDTVCVYERPVLASVNTRKYAFKLTQMNPDDPSLRTVRVKSLGRLGELDDGRVERITSLDDSLANFTLDDKWVDFSHGTVTKPRSRISLNSEGIPGTWAQIAEHINPDGERFFVNIGNRAVCGVGPIPGGSGSAGPITVA